eukprot:8960422-Alexandrium_andersonii.AAC.1
MLGLLCSRRLALANSRLGLGTARAASATVRHRRPVSAPAEPASASVGGILGVGHGDCGSRNRGGRQCVGRLLRLLGRALSRLRLLSLALDLLD